LYLFTQDDPFYLPKITSLFIQKLNQELKYSLIYSIVTKPSPFGKKETFINKVMKVYKVFGLSFFLNYSIKYIFSKIILRRSVISVLKENNIPK
jgi:methionyl-tRNA formyltransferase